MKYVLLVIVFLSSSSNGVEISQHELAHLDTLSSNFDNTGSNIVISPKKSSTCEVNAAQAALTFKKHGMKEMEYLFEQFSINDYKERDQNKYNIWDPKKVSTLTKSIETKYPNVSDKRLYLLILFCNTKDKNIWINTDKSKLSVARFFRAAFLSSIFNGTSHDAAELSNSIDIETQKRTGY